LNPFATTLRRIRIEHGLRQADLASRIGCEKSYISAIEIGLKGVPKKQFLHRVVGALSLTEVEAGELVAAASVAERKLILELSAPAEHYLLLHELREELPKLSPPRPFVDPCGICIFIDNLVAGPGGIVGRPA